MSKLTFFRRYFILLRELSRMTFNLRLTKPYGSRFIVAAIHLLEPQHAQW